MHRFQDKVCLITGAARGQGRAHALAFAAQGADVGLLDICRDLEYPRYGLGTEADLDETARQVEACGRRALPLVADVRSAAQMEAAVHEVLSALGRIDVLVCNAGITDMALSWDLPESWWDVTVDVNLKGCWLAVKFVVPAMLERGEGGRIVMTSSVAGLRGMAGLSHYAAAKHGVVGLARSLALELAPHRITVNTVHPTNVDTPLLDGMADAAGLERDAFKAEIGRANVLPVGRVDPDDVAQAVLWLASDEARYVTGQALAVDAGRLLR